jgi:hypothetical protein
MKIYKMKKIKLVKFKSKNTTNYTLNTGIRE